MGCIYGIQNEVNSKWYIGKCADGIAEKRKRAHYNGYGNDPTYKAIKKYGAEKFSFHILLDGIIPELLGDYEMEFIKTYNSKAPHGYNLTDGGDGVIGYSPSAETRRKMSNAKLGKKHSSEHRQEISNSKKGKRPSNFHTLHSKTYNEKRRLALRGKPRPTEVGNKISATKQKRNAEYTLAKEFFFTLPKSMDISEKRLLLFQKFAEFSVSTIDRLIQEWTKGWNPNPNMEPSYPLCRQLFFSLPETLPISEKRNILYKEFPDINKSTMRVRIRKWQSEIDPKVLQNQEHPKKSPYRDVVQKAFNSFPCDMPLSEKRLLIRDQFPDVKRDTINKWIRKWQSKIDS